jgi:hypothetical protein
MLGLTMAFFAGLTYGQAFTPILYMGVQENNAIYLDYYFACYTGSLLAAVFFFVVYCVHKRNKPVIYYDLVLPGLASGKSLDF